MILAATLLGEDCTFGLRFELFGDLLSLDVMLPSLSIGTRRAGPDSNNLDAGPEIEANPSQHDKRYSVEKQQWLTHIF